MDPDVAEEEIAVNGPPTLRNVGIAMRDGTILAADVYLPEGQGPWPTLLMYFPYSKDVWLGVSYSNYLAYFAEQGFAAVVADFRGTGASEGLMPDAFAAIESRDVHDLVEGLAGQPWSDGNVGVWGVSYGGITALRAAAARPPHLRAVVAVEGSTDPYASEVMRYGVPGLAMVVGEWATQMLCVNALPPANGTPGGDPERVWREHLDAFTPWHFAWREHPLRDAYWNGREVDPAQIDVPTMIITSWRDTNPHGAWSDFEALTGPRRIIAGPWQHGLPDEAAADPIHSIDEMVRWFDRWMRTDPATDSEVDLAADSEPSVNLYVLGTSDWEAYDHWPLQTRTRTFFLALDGALRDGADAATASVGVHFDATVGIYGGLGMRHAPQDQRGDDDRSTLFTSGPLPTAVDVIGQVAINLNVEFSEPDTDIAVRLIDVAPDDGSTLIAKGYVRLSNLTDDAGVGISPPEATVTVWCNPTRYHVAAGHRVRLAVAAADFPEVWPVAAVADYSVILGGATGQASRIVVDEPVDRPVGSPAFKAPDRSLPWKQLRPRESTLKVTPPDRGGLASVVGGVSTSVETFDGHQLDVTHEYKMWTSRRCPGHTQLSTAGSFRLRQEHRTLVISATSFTSSDIGTATVSVAIDGVTVFSETYRDRSGEP